jgi:hypothetical protein
MRTRGSPGRDGAGGPQCPSGQPRAGTPGVRQMIDGSPLHRGLPLEKMLDELLVALKG